MTQPAGHEPAGAISAIPGNVQDIIKPGASLPDDTKVVELITMLVRFRTQAVASVAATLAMSIESTVEGLVSQVPAEFIDKAAQSDER